MKTAYKYSYMDTSSPTSAKLNFLIIQTLQWGSLLKKLFKDKGSASFYVTSITEILVTWSIPMFCIPSGVKEMEVSWRWLIYWIKLGVMNHIMSNSFVSLLRKSSLLRSKHKECSISRNILICYLFSDTISCSSQRPSSCT